MLLGKEHSSIHILRIKRLVPLNATKHSLLTTDARTTFPQSFKAWWWSTAILHLVGYPGASSLMHNFCVLRLALSDITSINASVLLQGFTLSAVEMKLHSSLCTQADQVSHRVLHSRDLSRNPPEICFPLPSPQSITCDSSSQSLHYRERGMGSKQTLPSVWEAAGTTVDNPGHSLSGSMCCSCFGGWGEPPPMGSVMLLSNSLHAQDRSISTCYCQTQVLTLPLLPVLFWSLSRNSRSSLPFGVKAWSSADSDYLHQLHVACLACFFFYFLNLTGIHLINTKIAFWETLYLLNLEWDLHWKRKKRHSLTKFEVVHAALRVRFIKFFI